MNIISIKKSLLIYYLLHNFLEKHDFHENRILFCLSYCQIIFKKISKVLKRDIGTIIESPFNYGANVLPIEQPFLLLSPLHISCIYWCFQLPNASHHLGGGSVLLKVLQVLKSVSFGAIIVVGLFLIISVLIWRPARTQSRVCYIFNACMNCNLSTIRVTVGCLSLILPTIGTTFSKTSFQSKPEMKLSFVSQ